MGANPFPWDLFFAVSRDLPRGQRSLRDDAALMVSRMRPPPVITGMEHVPVAGPVAIMANHYQRRGLWIAWPGAAITTAIATRRSDEPPVRWLTTGGLRLFQTWGSGPEVPLAGALFRRIAHLYGMAPLPLDGSPHRAAVLRAWLRAIERGNVVGLFPEGLAGRSDRLTRPEPGFEALASLLGRRAVPIVPVGVFECGSTLHIQFGPALLDADDDEIMHAIAGLLPSGQRGTFGDAT